MSAAGPSHRAAHRTGSPSTSRTGTARGLGLEAEALRPWGSLGLEALWGHAEDQDAAPDVDIHTMVRSHTEYGKLAHRLIHAPLSNLSTASSHGRLVEHADLDPQKRPWWPLGMVSHRTELQPRGLSNRTLVLNGRDQEPEGTHQPPTVSRGASCRVFG